MQVEAISEGLLRGGARYLEAELKGALVNGGSDRDGGRRRAQLRGMQTTEDGQMGSMEGNTYTKQW